MKPKYMHLGELYVIEGSDELELEVPANSYNWAQMRVELALDESTTGLNESH